MAFPPDREPEALRGGRFVLVGSLGEGAQGHTFDAVDKGVGRAVAVKRFDVRGAKTWKDYELAERETRVLQSLAHPKLPRYLDHFEEGGALYLVMEKIDGESLAVLQKRGGILPEADVIRLLRDASDVLDYLHGRSPPVIHRDLKPGNVIRRPDGSFAFVDFGAVRDKLRPEGGSTVVGTFGYMAPEQFQGRALPASDVYSVGATALSLLTGRQPEDLPHRGLAIDVRAALGGRASPALVEMLTSMLDPDPDRRPARLAPVLERFVRRSPSSSAGAGRPGAARVRHRAERDARRAERAARRGARGHDHRPPWPVAIFLALLFTVGMVAVALATQVVVPTVLRFLATFFASRALHTAADAVRESGHAAVDGMDRSRRWFLSSKPAAPVAPDVKPDEKPYVRVADEPAAPKVRVEPGEGELEDDEGSAGTRRAGR